MLLLHADVTLLLHVDAMLLLHADVTLHLLADVATVVVDFGALPLVSLVHCKTAAADVTLDAE